MKHLNNDIQINVRVDKRRTGKTTELIGLAEIFLYLDYNVLILVYNEETKYKLISTFPIFTQNYTNLHIISSINIDQLNILRFDFLLIDDLYRFDTGDIMQILGVINYKKALLFATDAIEYRNNKIN